MKRITLTVLFTLLLGIQCASATIVDDDTINWAQFGPAFTLLTTPENWTSDGGLTGQVGIVGTAVGTQNFERLDQGNGWSGNFSPGDPLIYGEVAGDIGIEFSQPTYGGGAQIQPNFFGSFTARLTAYDSSFNVVGTTVMAGLSNSNADGSAIFIDFHGNIADVSLLVFHVDDPNGNQHVGSCCPPPIPIATGNGVIHVRNISQSPEPTSLVLFGSGMLGVIGYARRRIGL